MEVRSSAALDQLESVFGLEHFTVELTIWLIDKDTSLSILQQFLKVESATRRGDQDQPVLPLVLYSTDYVHTDVDVQMDMVIDLEIFQSQSVKVRSLIHGCHLLDLLCTVSIDLRSNIITSNVEILRTPQYTRDDR